MKLLSTYIKEMKIAFRGFYFYIEVVMAVIILTILLAAVKENPVSKEKEFLFFDMDTEFVEMYFEEQVEAGTVKYVAPVEFDVKAQEFEITNKETGETESYSYKKDTIMFTTLEMYDEKTGELSKTVYLADTKEDMIRLSYQKKTRKT